MYLQPYYAFRAELRDRLEKELTGPIRGEQEVIEDDPINAYISGVLYPQAMQTGRALLEPELDIDAADDGDDEAAADPPVTLANVRYPSSMGLTFAVDTKATEAIRIDVEAARYVSLPDELEESPEAGDAAEGPAETPGRGAGTDSVWEPGGRSRRRWQRKPLRSRIDVAAGVPMSRYVETGIEGAELFVRVRRADAEGNAAVTVVLVNRQEHSYSGGMGLRDIYTFFQPKLTVSAPHAKRAAFVERTTAVPTGDDADMQSYRLLYRGVKEFAVGHGCSVSWEESGAKPERTEKVWTTFAPTYELRIAESNPAIQSDALGMVFLAEGAKHEVLGTLERFVEDYRRWIAALTPRAEELPAELRETAREHIAGCEEAAGRMADGVRVLREDEQAWEAFRLMNLAMARQLARKIRPEAEAGVKEPKLHERLRWYPFQLAFILLTIKGMVESANEERELADLLWFPTGGGKTEAYLGLIAFTVCLRRLRNGPAGGGVTALMRYTLRLLTLQQFQRAALLICTLEDMRRNDERLGREPISIGMWVGQKATPNTLDQARAALNKIRTSGQVSEQNPMQIENCPWCGEGLSHRNYAIAGGSNKQLMISCRQQGCAFSGGLPVYVVDEDIYRYRPTLIISTVDKFASLPWRKETRALFNLGDGRAEAQLPPELIIQDELHLISGPLGTLTGLYETVVELAASHEGIPPKVIASTATIRRAAEQAVGLFNREMRQFPPPGLDAGDSYFAVEAPAERKGTRMYVGLTAPGTSHTTLMVRTYATLLQGAAAGEVPDEVRDPYWTLVGYFNSLRVLGGARMRVSDDVPDRIGLTANITGSEARDADNVEELTSREAHGEISKKLKRLEKSYPDIGVLDVVLATNMISVGVDIDRFGLMVVMGQPQSASEYIQATSRIGRKYPGLAVVLFNSAKSRDRSHYESFIPFHAAIYRRVESTSVTPFSARARDRGLHAVLIATARLLLPAFRENNGARAVITDEQMLRQTADIIVQRVRRVSPEEAAATERQLQEIIANWRERAEERHELVFSAWNDPEKSLLADASMEEYERHGAFATMWSLRDVDRESNLYLHFERRPRDE